MHTQQLLGSGKDFSTWWRSLRITWDNQSRQGACHCHPDTSTIWTRIWILFCSTNRPHSPLPLCRFAPNSTSPSINSEAGSPAQPGRAPVSHWQELQHLLIPVDPNPSSPLKPKAKAGQSCCTAPGDVRIWRLCWRRRAHTPGRGITESWNGLDWKGP